jgi:4-amino-4-deoxy-L-arabinose transferase-like glycosyltransferase
VIRRHLVFIGLLLAVAAVRFTILFLSQTHVVSDEAIVGLMAKHILEGHFFPFYLYGVPYSGSGAWEAYLAVVPFAIFGISTVALKSCTVALSLVCLAFFYFMAGRLYSYGLATWASLVLALWPALLKWHFQAKGYAFYFLSIPLLVLLFVVLESQETPSRRNTFFFGLACGISVWCLELVFPIVVILWFLLLLRRKLSLPNVVIGSLGFLIGYAPAVWWNCTHSFANWHYLLFEKPAASGLVSRLGLFAWRDIFIYEMPKFFGPDTTLWYYPETPWTGYVMFATTAAAAILAAVSALRWEVLRNAFTHGFTSSEPGKDLLMLILIAACLVPYAVAPMRVPGYFLSAAFFFAILVARLIARSLAQPKIGLRLAGAAVLAAVIVCGIDTIARTATHNQIETLALRRRSRDYRLDDFRMMRISGADIDAVKQDLGRHQVQSIWTTVSFVYPFIFESGETLVASESIFGVERSFYPPQIAKLEPRSDDRSVFVIESDSPYRAEIESACAEKGGAPPRVAEYGALTLIEERFASEL